MWQPNRCIASIIRRVITIRILVRGGRDSVNDQHASLGKAIRLSLARSGTVRFEDTVPTLGKALHIGDLICLHAGR